MIPFSLRAVLRPRLSLASSGSYEVDENDDGVTEVFIASAGTEVCERACEARG
ncbi:hypothetical protein ES332_D01G167500v1 [Gossypium tomentosum]|uniref:Uncharacterized protein n=1 Tax=Gossypium tomentosum TaxID=34277 RepID=A0A5D2M9P5_GOSTO|nr:hypothetical protein ES332_D01G167500v1 [Gossypium tomentosum]